MLFAKCLRILLDYRKNNILLVRTRVFTSKFLDEEKKSVEVGKPGTLQTCLQRNKGKFRMAVRITLKLIHINAAFVRT
ncbi:MAG: hypothetical protein CV087_03685 [Candidatus Brocadia sp. WS118]|nr:MAG: hypothetical protein CV087_03685 [Candidatus Brocadia sp. WS118]